MKRTMSPACSHPGLSRRLRPAGARALLVAIVLLFPAPAAGTAPRELSLKLPAGGVSELHVTGGNGGVRVEVNDSDQILATVSLSPKSFTDAGKWQRIKEWFFKERYESAEELIEAVRIAHEDRSRSLRIWLEPEGRSRESRVQEDWVLSIPRRLALGLTMNAADVTLSGVAGGIRLDVGVGDITAEVPGGDARIRLSVGDVELRTGSTSIRELEVDSYVGKTRVWMNGLRMQYTDPPGSGSRFSSTGSGADTISVRIEVGSSTVRVNEETDR